MKAHAPIGQPDGWGQLVDRNLFATEADRAAHLKSGGDVHSLVGDPMFVDPGAGDFRVKEGSPALKVGFRNFDMDRFGVKKDRLKALAKKPVIPALRVRLVSNGSLVGASRRFWLGAALHGLQGEEYSAFGVSREHGGVQLAEVPAGSAADKAGLRQNDLIQSVNGRNVSSETELLAVLLANRETPLTLRLVRQQTSQELRLPLSPYFEVETADQQKTFSRLVPRATKGTLVANSQTSNDPLPILLDGKLANGYGPVFPNQVSDGAYKLDLGEPKSLFAITAWSFNQNGNRARQVLTIFGSNSDADPGWTGNNSRFRALGSIDTTSVKSGQFVAVSLRARPGDSLGRFRWIVWRVSPVSELGENTAFQEFAVETVP